MPKRKTTKRTATKRKASKRKPTKRKATTRRATKRKVTKRGATKRKATKRTTTRRKATKRTATKRKPTKRRPFARRSRRRVTRNLNVFVSWSGPRSRCLATRLEKALPAIIPNIDVTLSTTFTGGQPWLDSLRRGVETADFALLCVASDNLDSIWMNFEAGALWETRRKPYVCPLLLDDIDSDLLSRSPIFLSHAKRFDDTEFAALCKLIADRTAMDSGRFQTNFNMIWPTLRGDVAGDLERLPRRRTRRP